MRASEVIQFLSCLENDPEVVCMDGNGYIYIVDFINTAIVPLDLETDEFLSFAIEEDEMMDFDAAEIVACLIVSEV